MFFPFEVWDLMILLAFCGMILFTTAELLSPFYGRNQTYLNRKRLMRIAVLVSILYLISAVVRISGEILVQ